MSTVIVDVKHRSTVAVTMNGNPKGVTFL